MELNGMRLSKFKMKIFLSKRGINSVAPDAWMVWKPLSEN